MTLTFFTLAEARACLLALIQAQRAVSMRLVDGLFEVTCGG